MPDAPAPCAISHATIDTLASEHSLLFLGATRLSSLAEDPAWKEHHRRWQQFISQGRHADMRWLADHAETRLDPARLVAGAVTALSFAMPLDLAAPSPLHPVARFARGKDYHRRLLAALESLRKRLPEPAATQALWRTFADTPPLFERALAARGGLGFLGKNGCFIHPRAGSFVALGEVFTDVEVESPPSTNHLPSCGSCRKCLDACPTGALLGDGTLDARRCLSWWTIEHRGPLDASLWPYVKECLFGCDRCQTVCPHNARVLAGEPALAPTSDTDLEMIAAMDQATYERLFGGTTLTRAKREGLRRNARAALDTRK